MTRFVVFIAFLLLACRVDAQINGQQPGTALSVCAQSSLSIGSVPIYNGGNFPVGNCLSTGARNPYWYTFKVATSGTLGFTITPNTLSDDYDFVVFDITGRQPSDVFSGAPLVSCNYSGTPGITGCTATGSGNSNGSGGPNKNQLMNVIANHTYALCVSHFTNTQSGYTLAFSGGTSAALDSDPAVFASSAVSNCNKTVTVKVDKSLDCNSIAGDGSDFFLMPGNISAVSAAGVGCGTTSFTNEITIGLPGGIPSGAYTLHTRSGSDGNSLIDRCNNPFDANSTTTVTITNALVAAFNITPGTTQCINSNNFSFANTATGSGTLTYVWRFGDNTATTTTTNATHSYTAPGVYTVKLIVSSSSGCKDSIGHNVTVYAPKTATQNVTTCEDQLPYVWNGISINKVGDTSLSYLTTSAVTGCDSTITLNLKVNPVKTGSQNLVICSNQLPYTWNSQIVTNTIGDTILKYTATSLQTGCDSIVTLYMKVNPVKAFTENITICANRLPYVWNGQTITAIGTTTLTHTTASLQTGCDSVVTGVINVLPKPVFDLGADTFYCAMSNKPVSIGTNIAGTYLWSTGATTSHINVITTNKYWLTVTNNSGCYATDTINVINGDSTLNLGGDVVFCEKDSIQIGISPAKPGTYTWSTGVTTATIYATSSGLYQLNYTSPNGCLVWDDIRTTMKPLPYPSLGRDTSLCTYDSIVVSAYYPGAAYHWNIGKDTMAIKIDSAGTYIVTNTLNGCSVNDTIVISKKIMPVAEAGADAEIKFGDSVRLNATFNSYANASYTWSPALYLSNANVYNPYAAPPITRQYKLLTISPDGCIAYDSVTVKVKPLPIPNAFSPNGDGINDLWELPQIAAHNYCRIEVFDRSGARVFSSIGYQKAWDGKQNGKPLPVGVYYFIIDLGDGKPTSGSLTILR